MSESRFSRRIIGGGLVLAGCWAIGSATRAAAQETAPTVASSVSPVSAGVLTRKVTLHLHDVALRTALTAIADAAHTTLLYSREEVPLDRLVSIDIDNGPTLDALRSVLAGTGLVVYPSTQGNIALAPGESTVRSIFGSQQGTATLSGLVTDSGTGAIITQAIVHVDGTQLTTRTNATGHYTLSGLAAGEYRVTARHVGYLAKTRVVTLTDSGAKAVDFLLNQPATTLNDVVTTALGDQRRYQVGNVISTINVDSIAPNAPVSSVTDLITGRAPGVDVIESSGMVGSGEDIRIRGISSLLLQSDPIIIVDGIRVDNTAGGTNYFGNPNQGNNGPLGIGTGPSPYRLNDLALDQIESIEILKGPAATTEYGTDAANGVIIIMTKRGTSGKPQWSASISQSASTVPFNYPAVTWNWGHTAEGEAIPFTLSDGFGTPCSVALSGSPYFSTIGQGYNYFPPDIRYSALEAGQCVADSTTSFNPLDHAATTEFGAGPSSQYGLGVGGGSDIFRYYLSGSVQDQLGVIKLPDAYRAQALALGFPNSLLTPNTQDQSSLMANTTMKASAAVDIQVMLSYNETYADFPDQNAINFGGLAATNSMATNYGYYVGNPTHAENSPLATALGTNQSQTTEAWRGSTTINWRPTSWLTANVTAGLQHEAQIQQYEYTAQAALLQSNYTDTAGGGELSQQQGRYDTYTVTMNGAARATLWHVIGLITTVGANYVDNRSSYIAGEANGLSASDFSLVGATNIQLNAGVNAAKSGGMFVEEDLSFTDRCYAPIGLRFDVASGYGSNVSGTQNPNYSLTCTVLTGKTSLRLRGAYGVSDQQPPYGANQGAYTVGSLQYANDSSPSTVYFFDFPGNQEIKPERDQALEGGFDLGLWNQRLLVSFTAYNQRQHDLLYSQGIGWDLQGTYYENVGNHRNEGMELTVTAFLIQSRALSVGVTLNGSVNHDKLLSLAPDLLTTTISGTQQFVVGYPLYGYWGDSMSYRDVNHNGILEYNEVFFQGGQNTAGVGAFYAGTSAPVEQASMAPTVGLWRNTVVLNAMFNYGGDYKVFSASQFAFSAAALAPGMNRLNTPLWEQAYDDGVALNNNSYDVPADQFFNGNYLALDELSAAVSLPRAWVRAMRLRDLSIVGGVRHLALWTTYPFGDPRVGVSADVNGGIDNDVRETALGVVPLTRQWTIRINAGL